MTDVDSAWRTFEDAGDERFHRIVDLFAAEPERLDRLRLDVPYPGGALHLDLSKQPWSLTQLAAGLALARAADIEGARARLFGGEAVNASEHRAVLHPALRAPAGAGYAALGQPVSPEVDAVRDRMRVFAEGVRSGALIGATGQAYRAVVHIGIGGSDLGPRLVWEALRPLDAPLELRFAANVDGAAIAAALHGLDPATTLVVVVSKTFTTQETMANAEAARDWLRASLGEAGDAQLVAVSAAPDTAAAFGVAAERVFAFRDWVGGRYSVWSAVGLSCAVGLGWDAFQRFLDGAAALDRHFLDAPLERSAPLLMALAEVWNRDVLGRPVRAVIPYAQRLQLLPGFLQQLEMESNGKRVRTDGSPATRRTAAVVFGEPGTNGQHAFFQQLHQGTDVVPVDFIAFAHGDEGPPRQHAMLLANALAQAEALMVGRAEAEVRAELAEKGVDASEIDTLAPQRAFPGDRPSTFILADALTPEALGALIALYEHKVFVEGVLWGINSFDQWGVELGKAMASRILPALERGPAGDHDPSTTALIARLRDGGSGPG